jgi:hypothetical protein
MIFGFMNESLYNRSKITLFGTARVRELTGEVISRVPRGMHSSTYRVQCVVYRQL